MAIVNITGGAWVGVAQDHFAAAPAFSGFTLTSASTKVAQVIQVPKTGTLHSVEFAVGAIANNPDNGIRVSFQNVDASGLPDGTQDQYRDITVLSADSWHIPPGPMTADGTDVGAKRSVTIGDVLAIVIEYPSFVASDSITINRISYAAVTSQFNIVNYSLTRPAASWTKTTAPTALCFALKYDTLGYVGIDDYALPIEALATNTFNNGSTPDERALRFQLPWACEIDAIQVRVDTDAACDIVLYDNANNVLASASLTAANRQHSSNGGWVVVPIAVTSIAANTTYRIAIKPTSVNNISSYDFTVDSTDLMNIIAGGNAWYSSTRTDAGAWTDVTTTRPWIGVRVSGVDTASGGGSGGSYTFIG